MVKLIVVLGATGNQGGSVVATYINNPKWKVRAVTRDTSKPAAKKLEAQGVEVVAADLNDVGSLTAAFKGANMVFAVTDFWAPFFDPATTSKLKPGQTINEYCYDAEVTHGKNFALALSRNLSTLDLLIWSSLVDVAKCTKGKLTWVYHFDSKAHIWDHIQATYPDLAAKTSLLFMGSYVDNFRRSPIFGPRRQPDGTFIMAWSQSPEAMEPFVDPPQDTGKFVQALEKQGPGKKLFGVSDMRSGEDFMAVWCKMMGVKGVYRQVAAEEIVAAIPHKDFAREIAESRTFNAEFGWIGDEKDVLMPKDLGIKTATIEECIAREDWTLTLAGTESSL